MSTLLQIVFYLLVIYFLLLLIRRLIGVAFKCLFHYPTVFKKLHDKNWERDLVYLHQFKRSLIVPNLSPFCLKLEAWLRTNNVKYKICESWCIRSREGLLPFIEINGEQIADSQLIISYLQDHFNLHDDLTTEEKGIARTVDRMIEGSTFYCLVFSKAFENTSQLLDPKVSSLPLPSFLTKLLAIQGKRIIHRRLVINGIGRHTREEIISILRKDIQAIDGILGDKNFLFGANLTTPDFTVFGHLATTYYLPYEQPIKRLLDYEFPKVRNYLDRIRKTVFPEWETKQ